MLNHLNSEDRFAVVEFSTGVRIYDHQLRSASTAPDAAGWVEKLRTTGGTDINGALIEAMKMVDGAADLRHLPDGRLPTEGEVDSRSS